ncbi:hypothetical protein GcC1_214006 [Golovinomyces cichoracearum]|uniref:Uncharacterized protein n=1 Tax=Golovinomyces cichoracearum TaxID=62708 RepID=A0A420H9N4_9PEZI|nr:hypothetical protein GcC1_214006 [Golovinomyces cichoracearum]
MWISTDRRWVGNYNMLVDPYVPKKHIQSWKVSNLVVAYSARTCVSFNKFSCLSPPMVPLHSVAVADNLNEVSDGFPDPKIATPKINFLRAA